MIKSLKDIDPKKHSKYSLNLYKFLKRRARELPNLELSQVFPDIFQDNETKLLWIGWLEERQWFHGCRLNGVLCNHKTQTFAFYVPQHFKHGLTKLPGFWDEYRQIGRCAIDSDHEIAFVGEETRWKTEGDKRECLWCGNFTQILVIQHKVIERRRWVKAAS